MLSGNACGIILSVRYAAAGNSCGISGEHEEITMLFRTKRSEWMQGLLWAEGMHKDGYSTGQLKDFFLMEGEVGNFWQGFDDYIGYCEERGL